MEEVVMRKIIIVSILLLFFISSVNAAENTTENILDDSNSSINTQDDIKTELIENKDYEINIPDEVSDERIDYIEVNNMPFDARGNISISIDGDEKYNENVSVGGNLLILNDLNLDYGISHFVSVKYTGDGKYEGFIKNKTVNPSFFVYPFDYIHDSEKFEVDFSKKLTGNIQILIDGKNVYNASCAKGCPKINLDNYALTTHTYEVIYTNKNTTVSKNGSFTRYKFQFEAYALGSDKIEYGDNVGFEINLPVNSEGIAKLNNQTYKFKANGNGEAHIVISGFVAGDNVVEFTCTYKGTKQTILYHIYSSPIRVPTKMWINGTYELIFNQSKDVGGNLTLSGMINGTFKVINGTVTVPIKDLSLGKHKLKVIYGENLWEYNIFVSDEKPSMEINIGYPEVFYIWEDWSDVEEYIHDIEVLSNYNLTGKVTVIHDNEIKEYARTNINYEEPKFSELGKHTITVIYSGDNHFHPVNKTITYEILNYICRIKDTGVVDVILPWYELGTLTVYVDNKKYATKQITTESYGVIGEYQISLNTLQKYKNYDVKVRFSGENIKFTQKKTISLTYPFEIYNDDVVYEYQKDNYWMFVFTLPKDIKAAPVVLIDGKKSSYTKITNSYYTEGKYVAYKIPTKDLKPNRHNITVTYPGDDKYPSKSINTTIDVIASFESMNTVYDYNSNVDLRLKLAKDDVGNVTVEIRYPGEVDFKFYKSVSQKNGDVIVSLPSDKIGRYEFRAYYQGSFNVENITGNIIIRPAVISNPSEINFGDNGKISVSINNDTNAILVIYVSGIPIAEINLNETNAISINDLNEKIKAFYKLNYQVYKEDYLILGAKVYTENDVFEYDYMTLVHFDNKIVGLKNINMYYSSSQYINLKIYDVYGKLVPKGQIVKIHIGKFSFNVKTNALGVVKFKIPTKIVPRSYHVSVKYKDAIKTATLKIKHAVILKTVKVKKSAKRLVLQATLKHGKSLLKGKIVYFKFNGKTFKMKTNKYGVAKVTIKKTILKKLKVGKKITYQASYLKDTVKRSAKVRR